MATLKKIDISKTIYYEDAKNSRGYKSSDILDKFRCFLFSEKIIKGRARVRTVPKTHRLASRKISSLIFHVNVVRLAKLWYTNKIFSELG